MTSLVKNTMPVAALALAALLIPAGDTYAAGTVSGKANFDGTAPTRRTIKMSADPACDKANPNGRQGEAMVISADGAVANVFVYVKEGVSGYQHETPKAPVMLDQAGCMYSPRVSGAQVGQTIQILNSDTTLHNVHALPKASKQFNSAMPMKGMKIKKRFTAPEVMVRIKCDVHPWMAAYVGVLDHPFHAVTGTDGSYSIDGLPAGTYTIEAWHERLGAQTSTVTVADGAAASANFSFSPKK